MSVETPITLSTSNSTLSTNDGKEGIRLIHYFPPLVNSGGASPIKLVPLTTSNHTPSTVPTSSSLTLDEQLKVLDATESKTFDPPKDSKVVKDTVKDKVKDTVKDTAAV